MGAKRIGVVRDGKYMSWDEACEQEQEKYHSIINDEMPATWHPSDGKFYTSKRKFRAATKAAGCVEIGDEPLIDRREEVFERKLAEQRAQTIDIIRNVRSGLSVAGLPSWDQIPTLETIKRR